jgi:hypothetical protein
MLATTVVTQGCVLVSADALYGEIQQFCPELKVKNWLVKKINKLERMHLR